MPPSVPKWYSKFEQGDNSVTDEPRPGCPSSISTKKIEKVKELLDSDHQMTIGLPYSDDLLGLGILSVRCLKVFIMN